MSALPPGPSHRLWSTYQIAAHPIQILPEWFERYGDPFTVRSVNGNVVMTGRPELVKSLLATHARAYGPFASEGIAAITGPRSLFQLRDRKHRRHRRLITPSFHGSRMRAYAVDMQAATRHVLDGAVGRGPQQLHTLTQRISLEVILRTVFGVQDAPLIERFAETITQMVERIHPLFFFMPFLQRELGGIGPYARFRRSYLDLDALLQQQLERARRQDEGEDVLSMLLAARDDQGQGLDDDEILDELRTLLFAGHETTGIALSWAVDAIGRHPRVAERLAEVLGAPQMPADAEPEQLARQPYLEAVCNETLRLRPIVTEVVRVLHEPIELDGYHLRPPTAVSPCIWQVHRNEQLYPMPLAFRPERFLERKFGPHEFLPFGGGHRRCIGAAFAGFEMRIVLGTMLREYEVQLLRPLSPRAVRRNVTLAPADGVPVVIKHARPGSVTRAA